MGVRPEPLQILEMCVHPLVVDRCVLVGEDVSEAGHLDHPIGDRRREDLLAFEYAKEVSVVPWFAKPLRRDDVGSDVEARLDRFLESPLDDIPQVTVPQILGLGAVLLLREPSQILLQVAELRPHPVRVDQTPPP